MKIAVFTNNYLPNPFGVSGSIESFRKEFEKRGHIVYIFAPAFKDYMDENQKVFRYPAIDLKFKKIRFPIVIPYSRKIDKILEKLEIDVIHSQHPNLLGWEARRWAKKKKVPLVFTWHTLYDQYAHFAPLIPEKIAAWWTICNARRYANKADQVVVPTPSVKDIIQNWGVTNKEIVAIPTGVEQQYFQQAERKDARKKLGIAEDEIALLLVSRLTAEKNVSFLAKALCGPLQKNSKLKFVLAGEGSELEVMHKIFAEAKIEKQIIFLGIVSAQEKKNIYAACDIFVYASKSETQGMIISEAMYMGLPIVALSAPGVKDLVANQISGLLVKENVEDFSRAVERLAGDSQLRFNFSEKARKIAKENYVSEVCGEKMLKVYNEVMERNKG